MAKSHRARGCIGKEVEVEMVGRCKVVNTVLVPARNNISVWDARHDEGAVLALEVEGVEDFEGENRAKRLFGKKKFRVKYSDKYYRQIKRRATGAR